jgi:hypothetical protein
MSQEYVTGMKSAEYARVFGGDLTPIQVDESIIDIGSGLSDLSGVAPEGILVQVDPIYTEYLIQEHVARVPGRIGAFDKHTARTLSYLEKIEADRVTIANALKYISGEERITAIAQIVQLAQFGIAQIHPFKSRFAEDVITGAEQMGFEVVAQNVGLGGLRQIAYKAGRINSTISIVNQPKKVGPSDRRKLAQLITKGL